MRQRYSLAALIINWNGAEDSIELLRSLEDMRPKDAHLEVAVIDNASALEDRLLLEEFLRDWQTNIFVHFRANRSNIGVPAAYNQAIQMLGLGHDYYLRLDNDVTIAADAIEKMVALLTIGNGRKAGIVGGNVKFYDQPDADNGGAVKIDLVAGRTSVSYPASSRECDGVLGCIMLLHGDLVRAYAPEVFDSRLFLCTDESELSLHVKQDGWATWYLAETIGFHKGGRSTGKVKFISNYFSARNWGVLRLKYSSGTGAHSRVMLSLLIGVAKSVVRMRWAYPLGTCAGLLLYASEILDRRARGNKGQPA